MSIFKPGTLDPTVPSVPNNTSGERIKGIDVYHDDDISSWAKVKASGCEFAFIKCSQSSPDPKFVQYWHGAKEAGLIVGAYHFMNFGTSGSVQAQLAVSMLQKVNAAKDDLPLTCDWEYTDGHNPTTREISLVKEFLITAKQLTGRTPIIYCSDYIPQVVGVNSWMRAYPWWIARYKQSGPATKGWDFWQFTGTGTVNGVNNPCDVNYFNGNLAQLKQFVAAH